MRETQVTPIFLPPGSKERPILKFEAQNVSNYTALLLSRDGSTLYVGARETLFALNSSASFLPGGQYQQVSSSGAGPAGRRGTAAGLPCGSQDAGG